MVKTLVSIIIPCYNDGIYLSECIKSVIAQTYAYWECIIIDDGSTDNTREVASRFVECDSRIQYYYQQNRGVSASRNNGISFSKGDYILPLDADDYIHSDYLKSAVPILTENPNIKVVYCKCNHFGNLSGPMYLPEFSLALLSCRNLIFVTALFRKIDFLAIGGYDERMNSGWEDWEFWINLLKFDGDVFQIDETYFFYRQKTGSRNQSIDENLKDQIGLKNYLYEKHLLFFDRYYYDPITAHQKLYMLEIENKDLLLRNLSLYKAFYSSRKYIVGKYLLSPFSYVTKLLTKFKSSRD